MPVQERREERKKQLKEIALQLFAVNSYEKTRVSNIVKLAGLSQGSFYWYFESKEACAIEILDDGKEQLLKAIEMGYRTERFVIEDAKESTKAMFIRIMNFAQSKPYLVQILLKGLHGEPALQEKILEIKMSIEKQLERNLIQAKQLGVLHESIDTQFQAAMIMSLLEGMLVRLVFEEYEGKYEIQQQALEDIIKKIVQFEFFGLFGQQGE